MKRTPKDYGAMLRELRTYVRGFESRDGYVLDPRKLSPAKKAQITRWHKKLADVLIEPHIEYGIDQAMVKRRGQSKAKARKARKVAKAKVEAVKRAVKMPDADRFKIAIVKTPMPKETTLRITKRGKGYDVAQVMKVKTARGRKVEVRNESRDWDPVRILMDPEGELRRLNAGDPPSTRYILKAGDHIQWRMGFSTGHVMLVRQISEFIADYIPEGVMSANANKILTGWATGYWAFTGSYREFKAFIRAKREVRDDMAKARRRAKAISKRERMTGRR